MWSLRKWTVALALASIAAAASAEPVRLTLVNPFPANDARMSAWAQGVNASGRLAIEFHDSTTALAADQLAQVQQLTDGAADIALVIANYHPERFADDDLTQLPGLFASAEEGSVALWRLHRRGLMRGYEEFQVLGLHVSANSLLHTDFPVASLGALRHKRVRVGSTLLLPLPEAFPAEPVFMPIGEVREAFLKDRIDGVITVPAALFGGSRVAEVAPYHLMTPLGRFSLALLMRKERFLGLPPEARAALEGLSGEALARLWGADVDAEDRRDVWRMATEPGHVVRSLSTKEERLWADAARDVFDAWTAQDQHHRKLLDAARIEIARLNGKR